MAIWPESLSFIFPYSYAYKHNRYTVYHILYIITVNEITVKWLVLYIVQLRLHVGYDLYTGHNFINTLFFQNFSEKNNITAELKKYSFL